MAYNPFNIFRRNQRAIFAVVTVFIMFTFVLSSGLQGGADFFDWLPSFVRGKAKKGEPLCSIDGSKVYERDLYQVRAQRVMAGKFMVYAAFQAQNAIRKDLFDQLAQGTPEFRQMLQMAMTNPQMAGFVSQMIANNPKAKQADKDALKTLEVVGSLSQSIQAAQLVGTYFVNAPNRTDRDRVDFMLWDDKAKALGIEFSKDDVKALIQSEFLGQFKSDVDVRLALQKEVPGFSIDACLTALAAEFRVRAAQNALLGDGDLFRTTPTPGRTPNVFDPSYDLFDFYRERTSPTEYEVLAVPAANFAAKVPNPSDDEVQRLFNDRKDNEPDPSKEEPGFREPRKVKVEWVSATGDEKYYQDAARAWVSRAEQTARSEVWGLTVPVPGIGPSAWAAILAAPAAAKEPLVYDTYQKKIADYHRLNVSHRWSGASTYVIPMDILDTSIVRPQTLAAAAGGAAGSAAGFAPAFLPVNLFYAAAVSGEQRARVKAGLPLVLGGIPGPGLLATAAGGLGAYQAAQPAPLPLEAVKPELLKEMTERKARELAVADLKKLKEDVDKLTENGKAKDKSAARAHVAEFVKTRGLQTGASAEPQSEWTIGDDPGLAPLKAVKDKGADGQDPHAALRGPAPVQFGQKFFWSTNPMTGAREQAAGTYRPEFYPEKAADTPPSPFGKPEPVFLAWRTEELAGKSLAFQAAKPRVIEAWKRIKARDLAKAEAERLANEIRAKPATSEFTIAQNLADAQAQLQNLVTDPKAKDRVKLFRIENVSPIQIAPGVTGPGADTVRRFLLTPTADLPYPTLDMTKVLIEERTKPLKTVVVQADQPKDTYYVMVLMKRDERTPSEYQRAFGGIGPNTVADQIRQAFIAESRVKARDSILGLIKKEFKFVETDEQKKKLDDREKRSEE